MLFVSEPSATFPVSCDHVIFMIVTYDIIITLILSPKIRNKSSPIFMILISRTYLNRKSGDKCSSNLESPVRIKRKRRENEERFLCNKCG